MFMNMMYVVARYVFYCLLLIAIYLFIVSYLLIFICFYD